MRPRRRTFLRDTEAAADTVAAVPVLALAPVLVPAVAEQDAARRIHISRKKNKNEKVRFLVVFKHYRPFFHAII